MTEPSQPYINQYSRESYAVPSNRDNSFAYEEPYAPPPAPSVLHI